MKKLSEESFDNNQSGVLKRLALQVGDMAQAKRLCVLEQEVLPLGQGEWGSREGCPEPGCARLKV